jgi:hypothetical protein
MTTTVRIPPRLEQTLAQYCVETRRSKSEVIIELLEQRFAAAEPTRTPYELACEAGFIGAFDGPPAEAAKAGIKAGVRAAIARKHGRA